MKHKIPQQNIKDSRLNNLKTKMLSAVKQISQLWRVFEKVLEKCRPIIDYQELTNITRLVSC